MNLQLYLGTTPAITVSPTLFGANLLFSSNIISEGFDAAVATLGVTSIRYPGGEITERSFDVTNPDGPVSDTAMLYDLDPTTVPTPLASGTFTGLTDFLKWTAEKDLSSTIVIPTRNILMQAQETSDASSRQINQQAVEDVKTFVKQVLAIDGEYGAALPDAKIHAFEIGNEYWASNKMTSAEYGRVADALACAISDAYSELGLSPDDTPEVLIQMGGTWGDEFQAGSAFASVTKSSGQSVLDTYKLTAADFESDGSLGWLGKKKIANIEVLNGITSSKAITEIDGVVDHYYLADADRSFLTGPAASNYLNFGIQFWKEHLKDDLSTNITEWNIKSGSFGDLGLYGSGAIIEQIDNMIQLGVKSADVWPLQLEISNDLAGPAGSEPRISPLGAAFKLMAESIVGCTRLNVNFADPDLSVNAYMSDDKLVLFVSSRTDLQKDVELDLEGIASRFLDVSGTRIGVDMSSSDGFHWTPLGRIGVDYYHEHDVRALFETFADDELRINNSVGFSLDPYETMRLVFSLPPAQSFTGKATMDRWRGGDGNDFAFGENGNDVLIGGAGGDSLFGQGGADRIFGGLDGDRLNGGSGNDRIWGGDGDDFLWGSGGHDWLNGGRGRDNVFGGTGNDRIHGQAGDDILRGNHGNDIILGGAGNDRIIGGDGNDKLVGGSGADEFVFASGFGNDRITDFEAGMGGDVIDLSAVATIENWADLIENHAADQGHRGLLIFDGTGNSIFLQGVAISELTHENFLF